MPTRSPFVQERGGNIRRLRRHYALPLLWISAFLAAAAWSPSGRVVQAAPGQPSYHLEEMTVEYPYIAEDGAANGSTASVSYSVRWTSESYPGPAECNIVLYDAIGNVVGEQAVEVSTATAASRRREDMPVAVSGVPVRAEGGCAAGSNVRGPGYTFRHIQTLPEQASAGRSHAAIMFQSTRASERAPGQRRCNLEVMHDDGSRETYGPITVYIADPEGLVEFEVPVPAESVSGSQLTCGDM